MAFVSPLGHALRSTGHEVRVATHPDGVETASRLGFGTVAVGAPLRLPTLVQKLSRQGFGQPSAADLGHGSDAEDARQAAFGYANFVLDPLSDDTFLADLIEQVKRYRPDLIIWDTATCAGGLAAATMQVPHVRTLFGVDVFASLAERMAPLGSGDPIRAWIQRRIGDDPGSDVFEAPALSLIPPALQLPTAHTPIPYGSTPSAGGGEVPAWLADEHMGPRVCVTLGTYAQEATLDDVVSSTSLLKALLRLDLEVVATLDPTSTALDEHERLRLVGYTPLDALLPRCDAVVHHLGMGTVISAARAGVPQVRVPDGSDLWGESWLAGTMVERGWLHDPGDTEDLVAAIVACVEEALQPESRRSAGELQSLATALPLVSSVVPHLEALAAEDVT